MINLTIKENINVKEMKVWRRKEDKVNKEQVLQIAGFAVV
jgi:hypothetical protein